MKSHIISFLLLSIAVLSCDQDQSTLQPSVPSSDRLVFKDEAAFHKTYSDLAKIYSPEELDAWAAERNHTSLLYSEDTTLANYSNTLKTILNTDREFVIGEDVIWFDKGTFYRITKDEHLNINTLKKNPASLKKFGSVTSITVGADRSVENGRVTDTGLEFWKLNARNQHEFWQNNHRKCGGNYTGVKGNRKYVHEIFDETVTFGDQYINRLYLRIKLEWKGSGGWKAASEQRFVSFDIYGWTRVVGSGYFNTPYHFTGSVDCVGSPVYILVAEFLTGPIYTEPPLWIVNMDGVISQEIKGDPASRWNNTYCDRCSPATDLLW